MSKLSISDLIPEGQETTTGISNPVIMDEIDMSIPTPIELTQPVKSTIPSERKIADLSSLPKSAPEENPSVIVLESPEKEILKDGGVFDEYLQQKTEDMEKLNESIDLHNQMVADALGEEVPENVTDSDILRSQKANLDLKEEEEDDIQIDEEEYVDPMEAELEEDEMTTDTVTKVPVNKVKPVIETKKIDYSTVDFTIDESDTEDLDEDEDEVTTESDENLKCLQAQITEKIKPVSRKLDLSTFTHTKKAVRAKNVVNNIEKVSADWALMSAGQKISMSNFSGTEIDSLSTTSGLTRSTIVNRRYKILFDHIVSETKPESVESWVKSLSFLDNDHVYMASYIATFADSNYMPRDCSKCKNTFLTDNLPIESMYTFDEDDNKAEDRFNNIMLGKYSEVEELYVTEEVQISDRFAIVFREPSVYSVLFEPTYLDDRFAEKYRDIISVLSYIDAIEEIDYVNQEIHTIDYKRYPANRVKDIKSRIIEYAKIINSLSPDEYNIIIAYINAINNIKGTGIKYQIPETTCPYCGQIIPAKEISAEDLVFTRHQLAALATTSIN